MKLVEPLRETIMDEETKQKKAEMKCHFLYQMKEKRRQLTQYYDELNLSLQKYIKSATMADFYDAGGLLDTTPNGNMLVIPNSTDEFLRKRAEYAQKIEDAQSEQILAIKRYHREFKTPLPEDLQEKIRDLIGAELTLLSLDPRQRKQTQPNKAIKE